MEVFEYIAHIWNEVDNEEQNAHGVVFGNSYGDAMARLEKYYGIELIDVKIGAADAEDVYEFEYASDGLLFNIEVSERDRD